MGMLILRASRKLTFNKLTLSGACVSVSTKEQDGAARALVEDDAGIRLAQGRQATELLVGLGLGHLRQLVRKRLDPRLLSLENGGALG